MELMSKIAKYLNGHIIGEVSARETRLKQFSTDRSFLKMQPELVVYPRFNEDIQKIMRFSWQLAEKGHIFGVTARGYGGSTDGSSIGKGIILDISRHLDKVKELDLRAKTVQVQAGANFRLTSNGNSAKSGWRAFNDWWRNFNEFTKRKIQLR